MSYITRAEIDDVFGRDNVTKWSNLDNAKTTEPDSGRIATAISYAETEINDTFRGTGYIIPFSTVYEPIKQWAGILAGLWLYESRPGHSGDTNERFDALRKRVRKEMMDYIYGRKTFAIDERYPTCPQVIE